MSDTERERGEPARIVYVPGAVNRYDYDHNVVILDENLKEYPEAHEYIKRHELAHARHGRPENRGVLGLLKLEFETDIARHFSSDPAIEEIRDYYTERQGDYELSRWTTLKFEAAGFLRGFWNLLLAPIGYLIRISLKTRSRAREMTDK